MKPVDVDPHLRAALRHAPDADLGAPPQVSAIIIAAARRSVAQRRTEGAAAAAWSALARLRSDLTAWRPTRWGASGALATVLMAGFITVLWRGEPAPPVRDAPAPAAARLPSQPAAPDAPVAPEAMPADAPAPQQPAAPGARKAARNQARAESAQADATAGPAQRSAERPDKQTAGHTIDGGLLGNAAPLPDSATVARDTAADERRRDSPSDGAAPAARREPGPAPSKAVAPVPPLPALPATPATAAAAATDTAAGAVVAPAARRTTAPAESRAGTASPAVLATASSARLTTVAAPPWRLPPQAGDLLRWLSPEPLQAPDAAWLARLEELTRGQWQVRPGAAGVPAPSAQVLQLEWRRGDRLVGQLWLDAAGVLWCGAVPPCERAALTAQAQRELLAALQR